MQYYPPTWMIVEYNHPAKQTGRVTNEQYNNHLYFATKHSPHLFEYRYFGDAQCDCGCGDRLILVDGGWTTARRMAENPDDYRY